MKVLSKIKDGASSSGKILFKKPQKRENDDINNEVKTEQITSKDKNKKQRVDQFNASAKTINNTDNNDIKPINNKKLLSFEDFESEETN
jgi:hypothetical protein